MYIFNLVYLKQEKGWQLDRAAIIIHTNFFLVQQEYIGMILPNKRIITISLKQYAERSDVEDLIRGIKNKEGY